MPRNHVQRQRPNVKMGPSVTPEHHEKLDHTIEDYRGSFADSTNAAKMMKISGETVRFCPCRVSFSDRKNSRRPNETTDKIQQQKFNNSRTGGCRIGHATAYRLWRIREKYKRTYSTMKKLPDGRYRIERLLSARWESNA